MKIFFFKRNLKKFEKLENVEWSLFVENLENKLFLKCEKFEQEKCG